MISSLVFFIIAFIWLLNTIVLEKYYLFEKEYSLIKLYKTVNEYFSESETNWDSISNLLDETDATRNIEIVIRDKNDITKHITSRDFMKNRIIIPNDKTKILFESDKESDEQDYTTYTFYDSQFNKSFLGLTGKLEGSYTIYLRTPIQSIKESVSTSNRFLIFVGIVSLLISILITSIISKHFTKPIKELNNIAQNISKLDFTKKYKITSEDEIGTLGNSINLLSNNLEKTIDDLKNANIELEKDVEQKSKLTEMRNQFISDVSHELKTPIALIQGYAEALVDGVIKEDNDKQYYCEVILDEANKMSELTKDLLDLSRLEYGGTELQITNFNIVETITNLLKKNEMLFSEKNIKVEFRNTAPMQVKGDIFRIEQVLTNYITNALKNVNEEKIIKISIEENQKNIKVNVFNSGKQISKENIQRIWTRFYKIDSSRTRTLGGTGLGLAVVKAIITKHSTTCGVQNEENGVTFYFTLNKI